MKAFLTLPSCLTPADRGYQLWFELSLKCLLKCGCSSHASPADSFSPSCLGGKGRDPVERQRHARVVAAQQARAAREGRFANRVSRAIVLLLRRRMRRDEMPYPWSVPLRFTQCVF